ncbi:MAG TPA: hypothetical protein EYN32_03440 [Phycisphaerales bacterium]|nr:hypothetical protein [Phycisphaerales bacterium]
MKITTLLPLLLCSTIYAQHPRDFIADDALSVLSIKDGNAINAIIETIYEKTESTSANIKYLDIFLTQFFDDPTAIDLSSELLLVVEPTVLSEGQPPAGMFGPMPHMQIICKAKEGRTLSVSSSSWLKSSTTVDGWFIASGDENLNVRKGAGLSGIFDTMPDTQAGWVIRFGPLWQQLGPIAQMTGGMFIGSMNKPDLSGVISKEQRNTTAAARKAFKALTAWCGTVENISFGADIEDFVLTTTVDIESKDKSSLTIDNGSMLEMATYFNDSMIQYAMSGDFIRQLLDIDEKTFDSFATYASAPPTFLISSMRLLANVAEENVVAYGLNSKNGLTLASLVNVNNQDAYLKEASTVVNSLPEQLLEEFSVKLSESKTSHTWDITMMGEDEENQKIMDAVVHPGDQLRLKKQGTERVAIVFGPQAWRAFGSPSATSLTQVIRRHSKQVEIDLALAVDFRTFSTGFTEILNEINPDEQAVLAQSPSAKCSLLYGSTTSGAFVEAQLNVMGLAILISELEELN